jgi:hypothetical protein
VQSVLFSAKSQEDSRQRFKKKKKHEKMFDAVARGISDLLLGVLIFGNMAVALYFGSVR